MARLPFAEPSAHYLERGSSFDKSLGGGRGHRVREKSRKEEPGRDLKVLTDSENNVELEFYFAAKDAGEIARRETKLSLSTARCETPRSWMMVFKGGADTPGISVRT